MQSMYKETPTVTAPASAQVAIANEQVGVAVSPTGAPKVNPSAVPWLIGVMVGAVAGLEVCATAIPSPTAQVACRIGAVALAGILGTVSPGWRSGGFKSPPVQ